MRILRFLLPAVALLIPLSVFADYSFVNNTVESVGSALPFLSPTGYCTGATSCGFVEIAAAAVARFRPLLTVIGVLVIVIFGYRMIVGQEDDVITKARAVMSGTIAGLIMAYLIDPFIQAFYGSRGEVPQGAVGKGVAVLTTEVSGIVNWVLVIAAALAVIMLIVAALKSFGQAGSEEGVGLIRKTVFSVVFGIILLVLRFTLSQGFVETTSNPVPMLANILTIVSFVMAFLALAAIVVVIYAGFLYVLSMGNEEQAGKAKGLLIRVAIGAVVILLSLALVNFIILPGIQ